MSPEFLDWLRGWLVSGVFIFQVLFSIAFKLDTRRFAAVTAAGSSLCSLGVAYIFTFTDWELYYGGPVELSEYEGRRQGIAMAVRSLEDLDAWGLIFGGFGLLMGYVAWRYWWSPARSGQASLPIDHRP